MKEKEKLEIGKIVGIICLVLVTSAIIIPLINNYLKGNIKILKNDMRIDYAIDDANIALNITSKSAASFKCYYGLDENNLIELYVSDNTCTTPLKDLIAGHTYYYKVIAYDDNSDKLFEKTFSKDYNAIFKTILKDKCPNLGYCNDNEVVYIKDNDTLYVLYKKDEEKNAVLGLAINNFINYNIEEDLSNFELSKVFEFLETNLEDSSINTYLIDYQYENDVIEKGRLSNEIFHESKINLLSWFDYENIKSFNYVKNINTILGSYQLEKKNNEELHYPIYVTKEKSRVLKNIKNEQIVLAPVIALPLDLEIKSGFGTIDEPFLLN